MARVVGPFKIVGTLDDLNFYVDQNNVNLVRTKGKTGVSSEEFERNPIFTKVKNHGKEFGTAAKKAQSFRAIAYYFNNRAKDGSFAGRANKLLLDVIHEDILNPLGERTVENGMLSSDARTYFMGFEGNKLRPLQKVLCTSWAWDETTSKFTIVNFNPHQHIDWPDGAQNVHFGLARANWDYENNTFTTEYSEELVLKKDGMPSNITLEVAVPMEGKLELLYLFIGFSIQDRKTTKELKRSNNTLSIIWSK